MTRYRNREIINVVSEALDNMPVVVLTGMRQVGKTTFLLKQQELSKRRYISLDDFASLKAAESSPEELLEGDQPVTIDEVHKCPQLLTVIKQDVDKNRQNGKYLLSGSANFSLLKDISETLAGRSVYLVMHPFSRRELQTKRKKKPYLLKLLNKICKPDEPDFLPVKPAEVLLGGMPSVILKETRNRRIWYKGYEQTYLERDLRLFSNVHDLVSFRNLLGLAALRSGQILKQSELARDAKLNAVTTARYMNLMETSFIFRRFPPFLANKSSRIIKSPKLYFSDSGVACFLSGVDELSMRNHEPLTGAMFETYIFQNISAIISCNIPDANLYYWNIQGRYEVDFIIRIGGKIIAIEVKMGSRWTDNDLKGLRAFISSTPNCMAGILAYNGKETVQLDKKIWAIPLGQLIS